MICTVTRLLTINQIFIDDIFVNDSNSNYDVPDKENNMFPDSEIKALIKMVNEDLTTFADCSASTSLPIEQPLGKNATSLITWHER